MYQYASVPLSTYHGLLHADSKGAYFNHHIRSLFPHERLRVPEPVAIGLIFDSISALPVLDY